MENNNKNPKQQLTDEEKVQKALLKAQRKAEFEAKFKKEQEKKNREGDGQTKTKAQLKAERRAKQEAQRAAKSGQQQQIGKLSSKTSQQEQQSSSKTSCFKPVLSSEQTEPQLKKEMKQPLTDNVVEENKPSSQNHNDNTEVTLAKQDSIISNKELPDKIFSHLPQKVSELSKLSIESIPPDVIQIGYRINKKMIEDPTARCISMLMAFRNLIQQYEPIKDIKRELQTIIFDESYDFLNKCRPLSISMINAIKHLKLIFSRTSSELKDWELRASVCEAIDTFIQDEVMCSRDAISEYSLKKIFSHLEENQTILTLGCSSIIQKIFLDAIKKNIRFKVVVVDTRPRFEGKKMVKFLTEHRIPTTYILINAILYIMKEVNKVMLEAHSVLCNGYVMSTIGSSQIALVAQAYNVPVVVCCETYKYSDRAYTDCFIHNELADNAMESFFKHLPKNIDLVNSDPTISSNLNFLDMFYDLIPREFISAVITEKGFLPCTSVPVILRFRETIK